MSYKRECYRKEVEQIKPIVEHVTEAHRLIDSAALTMEFLAGGGVADEGAKEGDAAYSLNLAYHELDKALRLLSHVASNVRSIQNPNDDIFAQEIAAWQRTHPPEEWYSKDYLKDHEKF